MSWLAQVVTVPRPLPPPPTKIQYVYCDATTTRIATVIWEADFCIDTFPHVTEDNPFTSIQQQMTTPTSQTATVHAMDTDPTRIEANELLGIHLSVVHCEENSLLCCAVDNTTAKAWARRGVASNTFIKRILRSMRRWMRAKRVRLLLTWIASKENLADPFTREDRRTGTVSLQYRIPTREPFTLVYWF